jgi:Galactose oxidase, central domain
MSGQRATSASPGQPENGRYAHCGASFLGVNRQVIVYQAAVFALIGGSGATRPLHHTARQGDHAMAGSWQTFTAPSGISADSMLLLTDGSVLVHNADGSAGQGLGGKDWYRLTPDDSGDYRNGTWSGALNMTTERQFFASGVLADGRVFAVGGEYATGFAQDACALGEIFDPTTNTWSAMNKPSPQFDWIAGDCPAIVLGDGRVLFGGNPNGSRTAIWDPVTDTWVEAGLGFNPAGTQTKKGACNEETWTLLPSGNVLTVQITGATATRNAEQYVPSNDKWVSAGKTTRSLVVGSISGVTSNEIGPAVLLPGGNVIAFGGNGHSEIYTPDPSPAKAGTWVAGPDLPTDPGNNLSPTGLLTILDGGAVLLPGGKVICVGGVTKKEVFNGQTSYWSGPTQFFMYDPASAATTLPKLASQPSNNGNDTWTSALLLLPNGHVLYSSEQNVMAEYTPDAGELAPDPSWRPAIASAPDALIKGHTYTIIGTLFNGVSQANSYGDDRQNSTAFPVIRLTNSSGKVKYLRSYNFSSMQVASSATVTADFDVRSDIDNGAWDLAVIANGIASAPKAVQVGTRDCYFIIDRSTVSKGEVDALINLGGTPAALDNAFYVVVEGFTPSELGGLNPGNLANPPVVPDITASIAGISAHFDGKVLPEDPSLPPNVPQRITFLFRLLFASDAMFAFAGPSEPVTLTATLARPAATVTNFGLMQLIQNPNPYILHGDQAAGYPWYLSVDMRVVQLRAGDKRFGVTVATSGGADTVGTNFITSVIGNLNTHVATLGPEFDALPQAEEDSTLSLAPADTGGTPVYNFAIARVRFRDLNQDAHNVRLFFRMYPAQQTSGAYDITTNYRSASSGGKVVPLLGVQGDEITTIPFFAAKRVDSASVSMRTQTDPVNVHATITHDSLGGEVDTYFGCWLDINQPGEARFPARLLGSVPANLPDGPFQGTGPLLPVQQLVRSAHQCLVAEISMDGLTIPAGADPSISDKLAQRNLTFVPAPNPGADTSRVVPQIFEVSPSPAYLADGKPDELMIDWGEVPEGSTASIYFPGADAAETIAWAESMYVSHRLAMTDPHTITCPAGGGLTYVPVAQGQAKNFAGLLSVHLPAGIRKGQQFQVVVRQITGASAGAVIEARRAEATGSYAYRRSVGLFALAIPISTKHTLLADEMRALSIYRWIEQAIPLESRWYPVFRRYIDQLVGRVAGMGGDPGKVGPTGDGNWQHPGGHGDGDSEGRCHRGDRHLLVGKIAGLTYDRFGDFAGFDLEDTRCCRYHVCSTEQRVEQIARAAWHERSTVAAAVTGEDGCCLVRFTVGDAPRCETDG